MGEGDHMSAGGYRRKADPAHAAAIKAGAKMAQKVVEQEKPHRELDVMKAEQSLEEELMGL